MKVYANARSLRKFQNDGFTMIIYKDKQSNDDVALDLDEIYSCDSCGVEFLHMVDGLTGDEGSFCDNCRGV